MRFLINKRVIYIHMYHICIPLGMSMHHPAEFTHHLCTLYALDYSG